MTGQLAGELELFDDWSIGVRRGGPEVELETIDAVADFVRTDDRGRYRPLSSARTLPGGWWYAARSRKDRETAIDAVYPLAALHLRQLKQGQLRLVPLDEVLTRQSGRYQHSSELSVGGRERAKRLVCGECVRVPFWDNKSAGDVSSLSPGAIPCPEPCSVLVAFCREAALWQEGPPSPARPDPRIAWAAFDEPGNELRERYLAEGPLDYD